MSEIPTPKATPPANDPETGRTAAPLPPPRVPDHELIRRIGRGAYGEVWLARSVTGAYRAVKIVHRQSFDHDRPFEREFEGILKFEPISRRHDSQVDILHVGRGDDCFYYVMELADDQATGGQINPDHYTPRTLKSDLLFHGRLPFEECVRIGLALATALENLHGNGLAHRDVKPSNIIFANGVPKLADIGLVAAVEATRSYVGTEGFAAPEGPGSPQADLYSLGKVLYEMATGKDRQEFPELPTQLRELPDREGLMELNAVIARACRHDPKDRYASATVMRADLELLQSGKSLARLHRTQERLHFVQRAAAVVAGIAALITAGWFWQVRQTHLVRDLAAEKTRLGEENRQRLVRLDIANGARLLDAGDASGALLWFADALRFVTNNPAEAEIHRIRIQQVLESSPRLRQVVAHGSSVLAGAFSPDGRWAATASSDGEVKVWNAETAELIFPSARFDGPVRSIRFSRDGRRLFVRSTSGFSKSRIQESAAFAAVLDVPSGRPLFTPVSNAVRTAFSPDDRWLAVAQTNHVVEILSASTGAIVMRLAGHTDRILALEFSSEGSRLLTGSADQSVRCWRIPSGDLDCPPLQHDRGIDRLAFSPNGYLVATAASEAPAADSRCWIQTWDIRDGRAVGPPIDAGLRVHALFFDPSGRRLFSNSDEAQVRVWEAETHRAIEPSLQMWSVVRSWHFSADGTHLVVGSEDGIARVWRLDSGEREFPFFLHTGWVECVQFSPDGTRLLTTSDDCTAKIWDLRTVQSGQTLRLSAAVVASDFHPEGSELLVALADRTIRRIRSDKLIEIGEPLPAPGGAASSQVQFDAAGRQWAAARFADTNAPSSAVGLWRQEDGHLRYLELNQAAAVRGFAFDATGAKLVTEATNHTASLWNTEDGSVVRNVVLPAGSRLHLEFGRGVGGWTVVLQLDGQRFQLYDLETGRLVGQPFQDAIELYDVRFSPDRKRFATAGTSQCGRIWDARTGEPLTPPFKHGGDLLSIAWSPDGRRVVTAGLADDLKLWDAATGARLLSPMPMSEHLAGAEFSSDGRFLVAVDVQRFVRVWDAATAEPITPPWREDDSIANVFLTDDLRLITVTTQGTVRTRRLQANDMNAAVLGDFACFVAGRRLNNAGALLPLKPEELAELNRSLRTRAPQLFKRP